MSCPGRTVFQFLFNEASTAFTVGLKCNHVPPFVGQLLEVTRAGGQLETDDGIATVVVAGKNGDPARAFGGVDAEGKAEEQYCAGGRDFLHRPLCAVKDRSSSASAVVESGLRLPKR